MLRLVRNQISKFVDRLVFGLKVGLIFFALIALLIAGASSVTRLHHDGQAESKLAIPIEQVSINPDPADISADSENMNPGSVPNGEPSAIIGQFILSGGLTNDQERCTPYRLSLRENLGIYHELSSHRPINSVAMVDTDLGRKLTLVGAKPDGTS